jgi:hypothetical protein
MAAISWIADATHSDLRDAAEDTWVIALSQVRDTYPDAILTELVHNTPGAYVLEAEHEDYLIRIADAHVGHLYGSGQNVMHWEAIVWDEDGNLVHEVTAPRIPELIEEARVWLLNRVDADRVAQADDPDRGRDS